MWRLNERPHSATSIPHVPVRGRKPLQARRSPSPLDPAEIRRATKARGRGCVLCNTAPASCIMLGRVQSFAERGPVKAGGRLPVGEALRGPVIVVETLVEGPAERAPGGCLPFRASPTRQKVSHATPASAPSRRRDRPRRPRPRGGGGDGGDRGGPSGLSIPRLRG